MPVLTTEPFTALCFQTRTTLTGLKQGVGDAPERLYAETGQLGLTIAGPMHFHYDGVAGDVTKEFDLLIVVPIVAEGAPSDEFSYQNIPPFHCATYTYKGPWEGLSVMYDALFPAFHAQGHTYNNQVREVYSVVDFADTNNHMTEIQVGLE